MPLAGASRPQGFLRRGGPAAIIFCGEGSAFALRVPWRPCQPDISRKLRPRLRRTHCRRRNVLRPSSPRRRCRLLLACRYRSRPHSRQHRRGVAPCSINRSRCEEQAASAASMTRASSRAWLHGSAWMGSRLIATVDFNYNETYPGQVASIGSAPLAQIPERQRRSDQGRPSWLPTPASVSISIPNNVRRRKNQAQAGGSEHADDAGRVPCSLYCNVHGNGYVRALKRLIG